MAGIDGKRTPAISEEQLLPLIRHQVREHVLILLDAHGVVVAWLCAAEEVLGFTAEEMVGETLDRMFLAEDRERGIPQHELDVAAKDGRSEDDRWSLRKDGTRIWVTGAVSALRGSNGELLGFVKIMRDRTDMKGQLDALANRVDALARLDEQRRIFFGSFAHELRNPLGALSSAAELVSLAAPDDEELTLPLQIIGRQIEVIRRLVDDLSEIARLGVGKVRMDFRSIEIRESVRDAVGSCRQVIDRHQHRLHVIVPEGPIHLEADSARLHQVLVNLLTNAAKYTDDGGDIWLKVTVEGAEAVIRIEDNGVGISAEMLPKIFELFTQVESSVPRSAGGMGIGLALVKELVTLHNGTVQVRSEGIGKGSEFAVRLPLRQPRPESDR